MSTPGDFIELPYGLHKTDLQEFFRRARAKQMCRTFWFSSEERAAWQCRLAGDLELTDSELMDVFWKPETNGRSALQWAKERQQFKALCANYDHQPTWVRKSPPQTEGDWNADFAAWSDHLMTQWDQL